MTGWTMFSPAGGDLLSNGRSDLVSVTREGCLFAWETNKPSSVANTQWWHTPSMTNGNAGNYEP